MTQDFPLYEIRGNFIFRSAWNREAEDVGTRDPQEPASDASALRSAIRTAIDVRSGYYVGQYLDCKNADAVVEHEIVRILAERDQYIESFAVSLSKEMDLRAERDRLTGELERVRVQRDAEHDTVTDAQRALYELNGELTQAQEALKRIMEHGDGTHCDGDCAVHMAEVARIALHPTQTPPADKEASE